MPVVVVTVTQPASVTAAPINSDHPSSLSPLTTAGIIIGTLLGGILFIALVLYLLKRYRGHKFTRVANPRNDAGGADLQYLPSNSSRRSKIYSRHSQKPSISSEPLIAPASLPPLPSTSRSLSSDTPPRLAPIFPVMTGDSLHSSFDLGEIDQVLASGTVSSAIILDSQPSSVSSRSAVGNSPPHTRQTSDDSVPSTPTRQQTLFLHRALKSRAQVSEGISRTHSPSLEFSQSRSTTLDSSDVRADEERLLAEAERTALRDAETTREGEKVEGTEREGSWVEVESTDSVYSQPSAPLDHSGFFSDPTSCQSSALSLLSFPRRKLTRASTTQLSPVAEMPGTPRARGDQAISRSVSVMACSSLDAQISHRTASPPIPLEQSGVGVSFPLLASVSFGKDTTTTGTLAGSDLSTVDLGSGSSGRASRYPSLALSSIGSSLKCGPRSDTGTDWHHPPSGLAGLTSLQIGPLRNPHSPAEERPQLQHPEGLFPGKRAHLREGTTGSIPEVEKRDVMQGGVAHIDVAL